VLRALIDEHRVPGRFLLLGSASPSLLRQCSESLAGRIRYHELHPFSLSETLATTTLDTLWLRGGFPPAVLADSGSDAMDWLETFIRTFLERDLSIMDLSLPAIQLRRFWTMLAHSQGQLFNASRLASSLSVSSPTTRRWLDVLTDTFMVRQLQPWIANTGKRMVRTPKTYLADSGIAHRLLGIETHDQLISHPVCGHSWEGFVIEQIAALMPFRTELYHYRTHGGAEIDLLLRIPGHDNLTAIEIKRSLSPKPERGFWNAMEDVACKKGYVVYPGAESWPLSETVETLPIEKLATIFDV
jgi:predicted AAA+ superfamily ATPase